MAKPVAFISDDGSSNYRNILSSLLQCLHSVLHRISKTKVEQTLSVVPDSGSDEISTKHVKKPLVRVEDSPSPAEILDGISELKGTFEESMRSLNFCEKYLESPTEKAAESLHQCFDLGERNGILAEEKIEKILVILASECSADADNEARECQHFGKESPSSETCSLNSDARSDCVSTISEEASKRDSKEDSSNVSEAGANIDSEKDFIVVPGEISEGDLKEDSSISEMLDLLRSLGPRNFDVEAAVDKLEDRIRSQRKRLLSLQNENIEILADLGEELFLRNAKARKVKNPEIFHRTPRNNETPDDFQETQTTNEIASPPPANEAPVSAESNLNNMHGSDNEPGANNKGKQFEEKDQDDPGLFNRSVNKNQSPEKQKALKPLKKTSSGEGIKSLRREAKTVNVLASISRDCGATAYNEFENGAKGSSYIATPPEDKRNVQSNSTRQIYEGLSFSVQQDGFSEKECISLSNKPTTSVATTLYNNYKLLLLSLARSLLSCDVISLKVWANQNFSIENAQNAADVFFKLDEKGVINAEDLSTLRGFFESILKYDILHIIDAFLLGDYSLLREVPGPKIRQAVRSTSRYFDASAFNLEIPRPRPTGGSSDGDPATTRKPPNRNVAVLPSSLKYPNATYNSNSKLSFGLRNENQPTAHEQQELKPIATGFSSNKVTDVVGHDDSVSYGRRTITANALIKTNPSLPNSARNTQTFGSNGLKLSKPQRRNTEQTNGFNSRNPGTSRNHQALDQDDNWLCNHYKRHCYVKFDCCDKFWPCHRCHNNQSNCGRKKLKSRDTKMVKCVYCNKEQPFGEFCCDCNAKFASYFCGLCLHLTGKDDHPYHCEKCGICRIHGDRSFHCDVCGVCLDVQLRGNHKCREGSAHDECCICLEDAFTGCQILPCSHKVHKECATQMIRSGITRCPICRESFAHKLERRPVPKSGKRFGK